MGLLLLLLLLLSPSFSRCAAGENFALRLDIHVRRLDGVEGVLPGKNGSGWVVVASLAPEFVDDTP